VVVAVENIVGCNNQIYRAENLLQCISYSPQLYSIASENFSYCHGQDYTISKLLVSKSFTTSG